MHSSSRVFVLAVAFAVGFLCAGREAGARELSVELTFDRVPRIASNQLAIWVEDSTGRHVKTLFVTSFTARRQGYRRRPAALREWVRSYAPASRPAQEVDAVSRATPPPGRLSITWDCTDEGGHQVAAGGYRVRIEGNLFWESRVMYSAWVELGAEAASIEAFPTYSSADGESDFRMISGVRISYDP